MRRIADRRPPPSPFARRQPTLLAMVDDPFVGLGREQGGKIVPQGGDFREQGGIAPASLDGAAAKRAGLGHGVDVGQPALDPKRAGHGLEAADGDVIMIVGNRGPLPADRKSTRLNSSHYCASRMPSSA